MARGFLLATVALLLSSSLFAVPHATAAEAKLEARGLPVAIVGASTVLETDSGLAYILGGRLADGTYTDNILQYNPTTGTNSTVAHFPDVTVAPGSSARYAGSAAVHNGKIYYFGGATSVQGSVGGQPARLPKPIPDIVVYDTTKPAGSSNPYVLSTQAGKTTDSIPGQGAWGMSLVTIGSTAYLFGGFTLDLSTYTFVRHDWILSFDMDSETITTLQAKLPYPVQDAGIAYVTQPSQRVYLFGGLANNNTANSCPGHYVHNDTTGEDKYVQPGLCLTDQILRWDPTLQANAEVIATKLPYRVQFVDAGSVRGGKAYLLGGLLVDGSASQAILEFNPALTSPLRTLSPRLSPGVFGSGVTGDGNTLTVWGGRNGETSQVTNAIISFDPNPTPPFPPVGAVATRSGTGIHLTWQPPTYDGDSPITGYRIFRAGSDNIESLLTTTPVTGLSFDDGATKPGLNYTYRITARNSIGESAGTRVSTATGTTTPGPVQRVTGDPGETKAILSWSPPLENGGLDITGYRVYINGSDRPASVPGSSLSYTWPSLQDGLDYSFTIFAVNAKGQGIASPSVHVRPAPVPDAPASVDAQPDGDASTASGIVVSWAPSTGNVAQYLVLRGTAPTDITQTVATVGVAQTTLTDKEVVHGKTYYYAVKSVNNAGESSAALAPPVSLVRIPGAPTNVRALGLEGLVQLLWDAPTDLGDAEPGAISYAVMRTSVGSTRSVIVSPPELRETSFSDRTATPGLAYSYKILTQNPSRSDPSPAVTAIAKVVPNSPPNAALTILPAIASAGDPVTLDASQSGDVDGTIVEYAFDFGDGTATVRSANSTTPHAYATNGSYTASVIATDDMGNVSAPATARIIVGELVGTGGDDGSGKGTAGTSATPKAPSKAPGSSNGKLVPAPSVALLALAAVGTAFVARRHLRR